MKKHFILSILVLALTTFWACQDEVVVHRFCAVDCQDWDKAYKARFHIDPFGVESEYNLRAEVRTDRRYLYKDLWLVYETKVSHDSTLVYNDTICMEMIDKNEEMDGDGQNILTYKAAVRCLPLSPTDTVDICIRHIMSHTPLPGVHDVGFQLSPIWK